MMNKSTLQSIAIIGGGPAGLMAAEVAAAGGARVDLFEAMPSVGRKLLVAGKGGLNLTHSEPYEEFVKRYDSRREVLKPLLDAFGPDELRGWVEDLGFETFTGTSGRVFPVEMKAGPLLHAWRERLKGAGVQFHLRHRWLGWDEAGCLRFEVGRGDQEGSRGDQGPLRIRYGVLRERIAPTFAVVLALGGGSWPQLGSTGAWIPLLAERGVPVAPLRPANCGFDVGWTTHFSSRFAGRPVRPVVGTLTTSAGAVFRRQGEFVITETGVEGGLIYALSALLRDEIEATGRATLRLDLAPDWTRERLLQRLSRARGSRSLASHLKRATGLAGVKAGLLWEFLSRADMADPPKLSAAIKNLPLPLIRPRPLAEAISSAGGVLFEALDSRLMIRSLPGVFCAGEMLDWEAPTGGYLLTACFASGRAAGLGALAWLQSGDS